MSKSRNQEHGLPLLDSRALKDLEGDLEEVKGYNKVQADPS
jgi:hypothetical protein